MAGRASAGAGLFLDSFSGPACRWQAALQPFGAQLRETVLLAPLFLAISSRQPWCRHLACGSTGVRLAVASLLSAQADLLAVASIVR